MKKLILIIVFLILVIYFSFSYLKDIQKYKHSFVFEEGNRAILYQKKDILLNNVDEFSFDEFFSFIGNRKPDYRYRFEGDQIIISLDEHMFTFPFQIRELEKEIVETIVVKEIYKEKQEKPVENGSSSNQTESNQRYFNVRKDYFTFSEGTDLSFIINQLSGVVDTNERIVIDYSMLNPNEKGTYDVYISSEKHSARIIVEII